MDDKMVIGLTGAFGSGCSLIADEFLEKNRRYKKYSLSTELKSLYQQKFGHEHECRRQLQDFGNELRSSNPQTLAEIVIKKIDSDSSSRLFVIDSIRNPAEIKALRDHYANFFLFAVFSDYEKRWLRVKDTYNNSRDDFDDDEFKDQGNNEPDHGQKVSLCFFEADLILSNNTDINCNNPNDAYKEMDQKVEHYVTAFQEPALSEPTIKESLMAIAYTVGRRSKCIKRRVGAIIVDEEYNILSSGFNGVPKGISDCISQHGECYRDTYRQKLKHTISKQLNALEKADKISDDIVKRIKVLELCRALHAEESAILNLVGKSIRHNDYSKYTLYATTYPCNLCANKIVQSGIKNVVYFEPYPVAEAKQIFDNGGVKAEAFEGVAFRAFFRAYNYKP